MRLIRLVVAAITVSLMLAGCVVFYAKPTVSQQSTIGAVSIRFTVCTSGTGTAPAGSCTTTSNTGEDPPASSPVQAWVAFRLPDGTRVPSHFSSIATGPSDAGPTFHFTRSASYGKTMTAYAKPGYGEEWVGYTSQWFKDYSDTSGTQSFTATVDFGLPKGPGGGPFDGPFQYQAVVGGALFDPGSDPGDPATPPNNEPVKCGGSQTPQTATTANENTTDYYEGEGGWICDDNSYPEDLGIDAGIFVNDAAIVPGSKLTLHPGTSGKAKFTFEYLGSSHARFKLSASTTVRGGSAHASVSKITVQGDTTKSVSVTVHAGTRPGTYKVKLTAKLSNGQTRTGTIKIKVL